MDKTQNLLNVFSNYTACQKIWIFFLYTKKQKGNIFNLLLMFIGSFV